MVPPGGKGVVGEKLSVIEAGDFNAIRSPELMANDNEVTCVRMLPEDTAEDTAVSADV